MHSPSSAHAREGQGYSKGLNRGWQSKVERSSDARPGKVPLNNAIKR
jgi:hypothetical protein